MKGTAALGVAGALFACVFAGASSSLLGACGPFTDVNDLAFCPFVLEIFTLGITTGTTPTTYDPGSFVTRLQMAVFLSRTVDAVLERGGRPAALGQFWPANGPQGLAVTTIGGAPGLVRSDGWDLWVPSFGDGTVTRIRGSDGKLLETWTGAFSGDGVLVALGQVFVTGFASPGLLYRIDPGQPAGSVTTVASALGNSPRGITFDGSRIWTANGASVSIVTPGATIPWTVTTVSAGFSGPWDAIYDGANVWITDKTASAVLKLGGDGAILQTITTEGFPGVAAFDGANLWVPLDATGNVLVIRAATGAVLATVTANGLSNPQAAAFDGRRVLVTNTSSSSVSIFKAADLTAIGNFPTGATTDPFGACSDGVNFWVVFGGSKFNKLVRF